MTIKKYFIFLLIAAGLFYSCSDSPSSIGVDLLEEDLIGVEKFDSAEDSATQSSSYFKHVVALGTSNRLLLGKAANVTASALIKFYFILPDSLKQDINSSNITVDKAWMEFYKNYTFGNSSSTLNFTAHKINSSWSVQFTSDSLPALSYEANDLSTEKNITDTLHTFGLNTQIVQEWLSVEADTNSSTNEYGLYLKPTDETEVIYGYNALGSSEVIPYLKIIITKPGVYTDTVFYQTFLDIGIVTGDLPNTGFDDLPIQAGLESAARIWFDVSKIPETAVINRAELVLTRDTTKNLVGDSYSNSLAAFFSLDSTKADSVSLSAALTPSNNTYKGEITAFVQSWVRNKNNQGLEIINSNRLNGVELLVVKGSNAADISVRPRLSITYTNKK